MLKKIVIIFAVLAIGASLFACGKQNDEQVVMDKDNNVVVKTPEVSIENETQVVETEAEELPVDESIDIAKEVPPVPEPPIEEVIDYNDLYQSNQVNEVGNILVVMYHGITDNPPYHRTAEDFLKDLTYMYDHGYRLISLPDYFYNQIDVALGFTPIVLTFDDGLSSTFSLVEEEGGLVASEETAIGILESFCEEHPDFGRGATLFINNTGESTFSGAGDLAVRLNWLVDHGYDIGNHTANHLQLSKLTAEEVQAEIGKVDQVILEKVPGYSVLGLSYPFGIRPSEGNRGYGLVGMYEGVGYDYLGGFAVGPTGWYYPPIHSSFDPMLIARARGSEGEVGDLWYYFDYYENNPEKKYISDGDSKTTVVPMALVELINTNAIFDSSVITYESLIVGDVQ